MTLLDTNVLVYAFSLDEKAGVARSCFRDASISVQALNEFAPVARRKLGMSWNEVTSAVDTILLLCQPPHPITLSAHRNAIDLADRYQLSFYDAVMVATGLEIGATRMLTEDMHDGLLVERRLRIENPFA